MTRRVAGRLALATLLVGTPWIADAQDKEPNALALEEVLAASHRHYPGILKSLAARRAAGGKALEAEGAFDLVFSADGFSRVGGFYDGTALEGVAKQPLRPLGASLYAGYKISEGDFPIYEDENFTNTGGAVKLGLLFSLLRDRDIDKRRYAELDAELDMREAEFDVLVTKVGVQRRALMAYWRWVAAGRQLAVYEDLLRIAIERQDGLEEQVRRGARAQIFLTENRQNITRRQSLVTSAGRSVERAANNLSLYYRDGQGRPVVPSIMRLPDPEDTTGAGVFDLDSATAASEALARRPELELLRIAIERERNRIVLTENSLKPRLDFNLEVQEGFGAVAEGGESRDSTDTVVGFTFSVPLQRRAARGRLLRSQAELEAMRREQQLTAEQIELELRNLLLDLTVSGQLLALAEQEMTQSEILRESELKRFQSGASDFFLVNLREETAADARIKFHQAELEARIARGNYDAATVNLARLGVEEGSATPIATSD